MSVETRSYGVDARSDMPAEYWTVSRRLAAVGLAMEPTEAANWQNNAQCRGDIADEFFPVGRDWRTVAEQRRANRLMRVCLECPVAGDCLVDAYRASDAFGFWAGTTPDERRNPRYLIQRLATMTQRTGLQSEVK